MENDCISRQDVIDALENIDCSDGIGINALKCDVVEDAINAINTLPSAQPERKMGKWIDKSGGIENAWNYCSVCGEQAIDLYDFCPNCGADMRGGEDERHNL